MSVNIRHAIILFEYSFAGQRERLSRRVTQRLWLLYRRGEIGMEDLDGPRARWRSGNASYDLVVDRSFILSLPRDQQLGAYSLELVHEAVHSVNRDPKLEEEVESRRLQIIYFRELCERGVLNEATDPPPPGGHAQWVRLHASRFSSFARQTRSLARNQLIDYVLCRSSSYIRYLDAAFIRRNVGSWGGLRNRWATTRGHYVRVLGETYDTRQTSLILDILESIDSQDHWNELVRAAGGARVLQMALDPSSRYLPRIGRLQQRWRTPLVE